MYVENARVGLKIKKREGRREVKDTHTHTQEEYMQCQLCVWCVQGSVELEVSVLLDGECDGCGLV